MPVVRRFLTALTAGALLVAGSLATASTASAHDQLLSSSPPTARSSPPHRRR
ncbi:hypothetical protein [Cellulomonas soli]